MIHCIFMLYDHKVKAFNAPFVLVDEVMARRGFIRSVNDVGTDLNRYPSDYSLYQTGSFDDETGKISGFVEPVFILNGRDVLIKENSDA